MNHHLRFASTSARPRLATLAALALSVCAASLFTSCQHSGDRLLSVSESVPPRLARDKPFLHVQCYFFTAPDDFQLLENTKGAHLAGIYSPQDGDKLVQSLKNRRGFALTSAPTLTMQRDSKGKLESIREFIYPTEYSPPHVDKNFAGPPPAGAAIFPVTPATPTKFETVNLGVTAEFEGHKSAHRDIAFTIDLKRSSFLGFVNYGSPITTPARNALGGPVEVTLTENRIEMPVFDTKRMRTTITLADRHYIALGGLRPDSATLKNITSPVRGADPEADKNLFALIKVTAVDADGR